MDSSVHEDAAARNGHSLMEAVEAWTALERIDERLAIGDCPLPDCKDRDRNFKVFRNLHS